MKHQNKAQGTFWIFCSEMLILPTGLLTVGYLTRKLGPDQYGLYALAVMLVSWIEWSINSLFGRATIKFIGEAEDWRPIGATAARLQLFTSLLAMILLMLLAGPISNLLHAPVLATYLRLFALDIPFFSFAQVQRQILVGTGAYRERAYLSAARWITRLLLIVFFVQSGLSITGAILGSIGASFVELVLGGAIVRTPWLTASTFPTRKLWEYAGPLSLSGLTLRLYDKMDLFLYKILGATQAQTGLYGAAQNLLLLPGIFTLSFSPVLLSSLSRLMANGKTEPAREEIRTAIRIVLLLLPFAAAISGSSTEIVQLLLGKAFLLSAPRLSVLIFSALALSMISINTAALIASGKPGTTVRWTAPMLLLAIPAHLLMIPLLGGLGASLVTTFFAIGGAIGTFVSLNKIWRIESLFGTLFRSIVASIATFLLGFYWPASGVILPVKLLVVGITPVLLLILFRELRKSDWKEISTIFKTT